MMPGTSAAPAPALTYGPSATATPVENDRRVHSTKGKKCWRRGSLTRGRGGRP